MENQHTGQPPLDAVMREMVNGFMLTQALAVVAELGIADHVGRQPLTVAELAGMTGSNEDALFRLIRYLASFRVFAMNDDRRVVNTPLSGTLRSERPGTVRNWAILAGRSFRWSVTGNLMHTVRTGEPAFAATLGATQWDYFAHHQEDGNQFNTTMAELSTTMVPALISACDFSDAEVVVDVGGGTGATMAGILEANPGVRGVLFDLVEVIDEGRAMMAERGLAERVQCIAGDFFSEVPAGGDLYLLRAVLHDWDDTEAATILRNCHAAMKPGTRLLLNEGVFPDDDSPSLFRMGDVLMMVMLGGRERTGEEFRTLLASCGFDLRRIMPTASPLQVIEAVRR